MTSPSPTVPQTNHKAVAGAVVAAVAAGLGALHIALDDGVISSQEGVGIAIAVVGSLGAVFGTVFGVSNKPKEEDHDEELVNSSDEPLNDEPYPGNLV